MSKHKKQNQPEEIPSHEKHPEIVPASDPEQPIFPEEPDVIPDEDPFENPPEELPAPGEGP